MICLLAALVLLSGQLQAQQIDIKPCGDAERVDVIAEPWEQNIATYAGLMVTLPAQHYLPDDSEGGWYDLSMTRQPADWRHHGTGREMTSRFFFAKIPMILPRPHA